MTDTVVKTKIGTWDVKCTKVDFGPIGKAAGDAGQSRRLDEDDANNIGRQYMAPPFSPLVMSQMRENSPSLMKCLRVMKTNVMGFGWELVRAEHIKKEVQLPPEAEEEQQRLMRLFDHPNFSDSFIDIGMDTIDDYEAIGAAYWEVVRSRTGEIVELQVLPGFSMRLTARDEVPIEVNHRIRNIDGSYFDQPRFYRFRRFVQVINGQTRRYFKEFGDPRSINYTTGEEGAGPREQATEVLMFRQGPKYDPYGQPRWVAAIMDILGDRKANTVNYSYFDNKGIPSYIMMISGGSVSDSTVQTFKDFFSEQIKGVDNYHKGLIIEAVPMDVGDVPGERVTTPKIEFKPIHSMVNSDAQYLKYHEKNDRVIREQWGLPPIYFGAEGQYNFATALAAVRLAEQQVFSPVRRSFEARIMGTILTDMETNYWDLKFKEPKMSDHLEMLKGLGIVKEAVPIGIIQEMVDDMRGVSRDIPEELYNVTLADQNRAALEARMETLAAEGGTDPGDTDGEEGKQSPPKKKPANLQKFVGEVLELRKAIQTELNRRGGA